MPDSLFSLEDKVAIVTGALGLLGKQHCYALAEQGARVVVADLDESAAADFADEMEQKGYPALGIGVDITKPDSVRGMLGDILHEFDAVDILVNNAAINDMVEKDSSGDLSKFENFPIEHWQRSIDVNITGTFLCCQQIGAHMASRQKGSIINIASTYGVVAPDQSLYRKPDGSQTFFKTPAYPTTKGAVLSLTRYLAAYWGKTGVRVNSLTPGGVQNGQDEFFISNYASRTPLGRMAAPTDYKGAIVFLASDASKYMTGANLIVDGGWTAW